MPDTLNPEDSLRPDGSITSSNGRYTLIYQGDSNLVLYDSSWRALWASNTNGQPTGVCIMQGDGNLVIYDPAGNALWASGTDQYPGSRLVVQDDGNVVIYQPEGRPTTAGNIDLIVWATNTVQLPPPPTGPTAQGDDMQPGEVLNPDQSIISSNGRYTLIYQGDSNLVLYDPNKALWASNT